MGKGKTNDRYGLSYRHWTRNDGVMHRSNGPALERSDGAKLWIKNGFMTKHESGIDGAMSGWRVPGGYLHPNPDTKTPITIPREFQ